MENWLRQQILGSQVTWVQAIASMSKKLYTIGSVSQDLRVFQIAKSFIQNQTEINSVQTKYLVHDIKTIKNMMYRIQHLYVLAFFLRP